jgi:hypothetical protein
VGGLDVAGMLLAGRVRPHVAALLGASTAAAHMLRGRRRRALAIGAVAGLQLVQARRYLRTSGAATLEQTATRTAKLGGSVFTPPLVRSPALAPLVPLTVLFRPHLLEAHNPQAVATAVENSVLFALSVARLPRAAAAVTGARGRPYLALALAYSVLFSGAFAGIANFGVLARQRVQLLPFYLALLSAPRTRRRERGFPFRRS